MVPLMRSNGSYALIDRSGCSVKTALSVIVHLLYQDLECCIKRSMVLKNGDENTLFRNIDGNAAATNFNYVMTRFMSAWLDDLYNKMCSSLMYCEGGGKATGVVVGCVDAFFSVLDEGASRYSDSVTIMRGIYSKFVSHPCMNHAFASNALKTLFFVRFLFPLLLIPKDERLQRACQIKNNTQLMKYVGKMCNLVMTQNERAEKCYFAMLSTSTSDEWDVDELQRCLTRNSKKLDAFMACICKRDLQLLHGTAEIMKASIMC